MLVKNRTNIHDFNFHLVMVTKYRKAIFDTEQKQKDMLEILKTISKNNESNIQTIEIKEDHIHLLLYFPPHKTPSSIVKSFKGTSAREWFKKYPDTKNQLWKGHLWSPSYYMSTVGSISKDAVMDYIKNQKK